MGFSFFATSCRIGDRFRFKVLCISTRGHDHEGDRAKHRA